MPKYDILIKTVVNVRCEQVEAATPEEALKAADARTPFSNIFWPNWAEEHTCALVDSVGADGTMDGLEEKYFRYTDCEWEEIT